LISAGRKRHPQFVKGGETRVQGRKRSLLLQLLNWERTPWRGKNSSYGKRDENCSPAKGPAYVGVLKKGGRGSSVDNGQVPSVWAEKNSLFKKEHATGLIK